MASLLFVIPKNSTQGYSDMLNITTFLDTTRGCWCCSSSGPVAVAAPFLINSECQTTPFMKTILSQPPFCDAGCQGKQLCWCCCNCFWYLYLQGRQTFDSGISHCITFYATTVRISPESAWKIEPYMISVISGWNQSREGILNMQRHLSMQSFLLKRKQMFWRSWTVVPFSVSV